jgi:hypothetical protein
MKKILLLAIIFIFTGCQDQAGVLVEGIFTNLFNGNLFESSATDKAYDQLKSKTDVESIVTPDCVTKTEDIISGSIVSNLSTLKDKMCTCLAWGSCDKRSCSCDKLCPLNFEILNRGPQSTGSRIEDQFAFNNTSIGKNYTSYQGFCWGFASLTQKFNRLATFSLMKKLPDSVEKDSFSKLDYYKEIITKIKNNEPVEIPGYSSLNQFSSDPMIQELLVPEIEDVWKANAASWQGLQSVREGERMKYSEYDNLFTEIEDQIENHQTPKVLFNQVGISGWAHVVQVQSVKKDPNGKKYLCVWDNSYPLEYSLDCKKKMELSPTGELKYGFYNVGKIELPHDEKSETVAQVNNLQKNCSVKYQCTTE